MICVPISTDVKETIGTGGFAKVKIARHKLTQVKVAIKIMIKEKLKKTVGSGHR